MKVSFKNPPSYPAHSHVGWHEGLHCKACFSRLLGTNGHVWADSYRLRVKPRHRRNHTSEKFIILPDYNGTWENVGTEFLFTCQTGCWLSCFDFLVICWVTNYFLPQQVLWVWHFPIRSFQSTKQGLVFQFRRLQTQQLADFLSERWFFTPCHLALTHPEEHLAVLAGLFLYIPN